MAKDNIQEKIIVKIQEEINCLTNVTNSMSGGDGLIKAKIIGEIKGLSTAIKIVKGEEYN